MLMFIIACFILALPIAVVVVAVKQMRAETVICPHCGKSFKLIGGSHKCPKCRTRVTRTSDGRLISS